MEAKAIDVKFLATNVDEAYVKYNPNAKTNWITCPVCRGIAIATWTVGEWWVQCLDDDFDCLYDIFVKTLKFSN